ncbi:hypothetical protein CC80DRAFT_434596, partial [Byssothecium circinans]
MPTVENSDPNATRQARRFLQGRVRNDWDWPDAPECWSASDEEVRNVESFRERYYGTSSPSASDNDSTTQNDPYQFEGPDSIGQALDRQKESKKRKKREQLQEECSVNEGLRIFCERRDRWTGVDSVRKYALGGKRALSSDVSTPMETDTQASPTTPDSAPTNRTHSQPIPTSPEPLIPIAPTLLPDNPTRQAIGPKTYSDIYSKIVLQSRTPSVPINLADMTKALVQGWKENGEWPPKAAPLDPLAGNKRIGLVGVGNGKTESGVAGEPFLSHHPHLQKGVEGVKRMLHFGGHHD